MRKVTPFVTIAAFMPLLIGGTSGYPSVGSPTFAQPNAPGPNIVNARQYGAKGDGVTDDTAAINAAAAQFRSLLRSGATAAFYLTGGNFLVAKNGGVDFTALKNGSVVFDGATILCKVTTVCIDATGSEHMTWTGVSFQGNQAVIPTVGLQIARQNGGTSDCANQTFYGIKAGGYFSQTAVLNGACETDQFFGGWIMNDNPASGCYAYIMDGVNHWNWQSAFETITTPRNGTMSQGDNLHAGLTFVSSCASNAVIWMENTQHTGFQTSYLLSRGPTAAFALYDDSIGANTLVEVNMHSEGGANFNYIFLQTGSNANPTLAGVDYTDHQSQAKVSVFQADVGISGVTFRGSARFTQNAATPPKVFSQPSLWSVTGNFDLPVAGYWGAPAVFHGFLCLVTVCTVQ